jgi:PEGA domain
MDWSKIMKKWPAIIGIAVILVVFCSPALAISKSDLLSQQAGTAWDITAQIGRSTGWERAYSWPEVSPGMGTGTLVIWAYPEGGKVYLDGDYQGDTPVYFDTPWGIRGFNPLTLEGLPAGTHHLRVTDEGYWDYSTTVTITAGKAATVEVYLRRLSPACLPTKTPTNAPTSLPTPIPRILPDTLPSKEELIDSYSPKPYNNVGEGVMLI